MAPLGWPNLQWGGYTLGELEEGLVLRVQPAALGDSNAASSAPGYGGFPLASACILHVGVGLAGFDVIHDLCFMLVELSQNIPFHSKNSVQNRQ